MQISKIDQNLNTKDTFTAILIDGGANKIAVIKEIRGITGLGLKEAKDLVTEAPKTIKTGISLEVAYEIKKAIGYAGGMVAIYNDAGNHDVILLEANGDKIKLAKSIHEITGCSQRNALDFLKKLPRTVKADVPKDEAEKIKKKIEKAGGKAEIVYKDTVEFDDNIDTEEFDVILIDSGGNSVAVTNEIHGITGLELKEAMEFVENAPNSIITGVSLDDVADISKKLLIAGATIQILPSHGMNEQTDVDVILADGGANKIAVIKEVCGITGLGLKEAKDLVTEAPKPVKTGISQDEANEIKKKLEKAGAKVEIIPYLVRLLITNVSAKNEPIKFDVILADGGANKIAVIKEVRGITGLGLKEAKDLVTEAPKPVKTGVSNDEANEIKKKLEEAGAKVEIKSDLPISWIKEVFVKDGPSGYDVILADGGANRIAVIKEVRGITGLGLKEAKDLVTEAPKPVKIGVSQDEAREIKKRLEEIGAKVEIKSGSKELINWHASEAPVEKAKYDVIFIKNENNYIKNSLYKVLHSITGFGRTEVDHFVHDAPKLLKTGISEEEACEIKKRIEDAGGRVEIRPEMSKSPMANSVNVAAVPMEEEQTEFDVILADGGANIIAVAKMVTDITGCKDPRSRNFINILNNTPIIIKSGIMKAEAQKIKNFLEDAGAKVEIKPVSTIPQSMFVSAGTALPAEEEQTEFDVILADGGANMIAVIKEIRGITGLGLKEAKDLVTEAPKPVKTGVSKDEAYEIKKKLEEVGAKVEIRPDPTNDGRVEQSDDQEETEYKITFQDSGINPSAVIKVKRGITVLASKDIKELVMEALKPIMKDVLEYEAREIKRKAEEVGIKVEIRPGRFHINQAGGAAVPAEEEQTEFDVILVDYYHSPRVDIIRPIREITGLGLKEAKDLITEAPKPIKTGVSKDEAYEIKKKLEEAGAKVEIK